jgi:hypothetical protein
MTQGISGGGGSSCSSILIPRITEGKHAESKHKRAQTCQPETLYISTDDSPRLTQGWVLITPEPPYGRAIS